MHETSQFGAQPFFGAGSGAAAAELAAIDWRDHPLGTPALWPPLLRAMVATILAAPQPMFLAWGADLHFFFNDAYRPLMGARGEGAAGRPFVELWSNEWEALRPIVERALAGEGERFEDWPLLVTRNGYPEQTWWSFSYMPLYGDDGAVAGMWCVTSEATSAVLGRRAAAAERERQQLAVRQMPGFVCILVGPEHRYHYVNDAYVTIGGPRDYIGRTVREVFPELAGQGFYALLDTVYATGEPFHALDMPVDLAGEAGTRYIDFLYHAVRDDAGAVSGIFVGGYDVTSRKHAQDDLRRLTTTLEQQVDARTRERDQLWSLSEDLLVVASYDGRLLRVSPSWMALTGLDERALLRDDYTRITHPDDRDRSMALVGAMRAEGQAARFENRILAADGTWHWIAWTLSPEPAGERFTGVGRDITAERQAQAMLRDTEDFARLALSAVGGVGVWTYDVASDRFFCDAEICALYGLDSAAGAAGLRRSAFLANVHPDDAAPLQKTMSGGWIRPGDLELEYRILHPDGSTRWVLSRGHTYFDANGLPMRRTGIGIEVTRQRQLEEQLRQAQKMDAIGQLTGGVAHDFNNLLTVIRGSVDLIRRGDVSEARRARYIDAIADTADRASKLTAQLLAFARRTSLQPEVFDARVAIRSVAEMIATLAGSGIAITTDLADTACYVNADPNQFDTAIVNLAINARDAMEGEGTLTITVAKADGRPAVRERPAEAGAYIAVSVADTGGGIDPVLIDRIFEPFFTTKRVGKGTGLGLSQVFGFSRQSGGEIGVESEPGAGTRFTLYLPKAAAPEARIDPARPGELAEGHGLWVLVVEDNPDVGTFAMRALAELGYNTSWTPMPRKRWRCSNIKRTGSTSFFRMWSCRASTAWNSHARSARGILICR